MTAQAQRPSDLAGEITVSVSDQHANFFVRNMVAVLVEQDLRPYGRYGYWEPVKRDLIEWPALLELIVVRAYVALRPWTRPDKPWPVITLFGPLERVERLWRRVRLR
jgi:hypothetical protein